MKRQQRNITDFKKDDKFNMYGDWLKKINHGSPQPMVKISGEKHIQAMNLLNRDKVDFTKQMKIIPS